MRVKESDRPGLGLPLPIASIDELTRLDVGEDIISLGYPMENLPRVGVDIQKPRASAQRGCITSLKNFFMSKATPSEAMLVQHDLPTVGGTSGSPLFDSAGKVIAVHCAGSFAFFPDVRVPLVAGMKRT